MLAKVTGNVRFARGVYADDMQICAGETGRLISAEVEGDQTLSAYIKLDRPEITERIVFLTHDELSAVVMNGPIEVDVRTRAAELLQCLRAILTIAVFPVWIINSWFLHKAVLHAPGPSEVFLLLCGIVGTLTFLGRYRLT